MSAPAATQTKGTSVSSQETPAPDAARSGWPPRRPRRMLASLLPGLAVNLAGPPLAYALIRPHLASAAMALLAAMAVPAAWTLVTAAWRRRVSWLGLASAALTGAAVAVTYLTGGSPLAAELQDPAATGVIGLACLVSVIAGRPLWMTVLRLVTRQNAQAARRLADPAVRHAATVETLIVGGFLFVHAAAITALALTLPAGTFAALYRPVGLPILAAGLVILIAYRRRRASTPAGQAAGGNRDDQRS